ncbi:hypothetical protein J6590_030160 [Homalodisca vitripennis]|nr:hypothetical protein J6590_030160 [Homalodisca vitripennis]
MDVVMSALNDITVLVGNETKTVHTTNFTAIATSIARYGCYNQRLGAKHSRFFVQTWLLFAPRLINYECAVARYRFNNVVNDSMGLRVICRDIRFKSLIGCETINSGKGKEGMDDAESFTNDNSEEL